MSQKWNLQDIRRTETRRGGSADMLGVEKNNVQQTNHQRPRMRDIRVGQPSHRHNYSSERSPLQTHSALAETTPDEDALQISHDRIPVVDGKARTKRRYIMALIIFVLIIAGGVTIGNLTGGATVTIEPKSRTLNVNADFTAYRTERAGELTYEIMTIKATSERQVEASGQEEVRIQATGDIEITKSTPGAERLIKNTRFSTSDGKIFRIEESVVVPGAVTDSTGRTVPGSIRAKVFADQPGDSYNLPAGTELTVPGFKEGNFLDLYNAIEAKNPTAFTNGFSGPKFIIDEAALSTARQSLQAELRDTLLDRVKTEKPAHVTAFNGSIAINYTPLPPVQYGDTLVTIREEATLQMPLFNAENFASFLAEKTIVGYDRKPVRIDNVDDLTFAYQSATTSQINIADLESLEFELVGEPTIVWTYDEGKLKLELAGKEKTAIPQIMSAYPGIERTTVTVRPVWKRSLPTDTADITVIETLE